MRPLQSRLHLYILWLYHLSEWLHLQCLNYHDSYCILGKSLLLCGCLQTMSSQPSQLQFNHWSMHRRMLLWNSSRLPLPWCLSLQLPALFHFDLLHCLCLGVLQRSGQSLLLFLPRGYFPQQLPLDMRCVSSQLLGMFVLDNMQRLFIGVFEEIRQSLLFFMPGWHCLGQHNSHLRALSLGVCHLFFFYILLELPFRLFPTFFN